MKLARRDRRTRANIASLRHYDAAFRVGTRHGDRETSRRCSSLRCSLKAMLLYASEMVNRVVAKAVQIHGSSGYSRESDVERMYRDARVITIYEGTSEIQRTIIAREILK